MIHKFKIALAAAISLISGAAYATQLGSVVLTEVSGCDLTNSPPSPIVGAITLGTATLSNGHLMYYVSEIINYPSGLSNSYGYTERAENFNFNFDYTAKTYTVTAPGNHASIGASSNTLLSGSFTGTILTNSSGGYAITVTLGCGTTLVGTTENTGT
jgi:hypothetical protein